MNRSRFKIGSRVSIEHKQITGHHKRTAYSYGTVVERPVGAAVLPSHGGFHYVLIDGTSQPVMQYGRKLHVLEEVKAAMEAKRC